MAGDYVYFNDDTGLTLTCKVYYRSGDDMVLRSSGVMTEAEIDEEGIGIYSRFVDDIAVGDVIKIFNGVILKGSAIYKPDVNVDVSLLATEANVDAVETKVDGVKEVVDSLNLELDGVAKEETLIAGVETLGEAIAAIPEPDLSEVAKEAQATLNKEAIIAAIPIDVATETNASQNKADIIAAIPDISDLALQDTLEQVQIQTDKIVDGGATEANVNDKISGAVVTLGEQHGAILSGVVNVSDKVDDVKDVVDGLNLELDGVAKQEDLEALAGVVSDKLDVKVSSRSSHSPADVVISMDSQGTKTYMIYQKVTAMSTDGVDLKATAFDKMVVADPSGDPSEWSAWDWIMFGLKTRWANKTLLNHKANLFTIYKEDGETPLVVQETYEKNKIEMIDKVQVP